LEDHIQRQAAIPHEIALWAVRLGSVDPVGDGEATSVREEELVLGALQLV
jgi:hypothetical protein